MEITLAPSLYSRYSVPWFGFKAINITLGLKYLRVSPDHGTAKNLIKKNKSDPSSLLECISFLGKF